MNKNELYKWMSKFVCEVRKVDGSEYPSKSLLSLCMGKQGHLRLETKQPIDFLRSPDCELFRQVLDSRMKTLTRQGQSPARQAEVFTPEQEHLFWKNKLLGDHYPKVLLRAMVYLNRRNFALRSGSKHRFLRFMNSQITLKENGNSPFIEDASKTNQGGLRHRRVTPKSATIYANTECPERCHVRLYKLYMKMSPTTETTPCICHPILKPNDKVWFSHQAVGHNTLQKVIPDMVKDAGLAGHYTNHSLRATAATSLFRAGVDEQLIMAQTGHRTHSGVRNYKRVHEEQQKEVSRVLNNAKWVHPEPKEDKTDNASGSSSALNTAPSVDLGDSRYTFVNCNVTFTHK